MAKKKSRRTGSSTTPRRLSTAAVSVSPVAATGKEVDLGKEYHYILHDLRMTGLIAASLIAGLVILSFFLR